MRTRRNIVLNAHAPVRVGEEAARRIARAWADPLDLGTDEEYAGGDDGLMHVMRVARAALEGTLPIDPRHPRAAMRPMTREMLRAAGVNSDAFAALAALEVSGGLYIEGPDGRTLAKATGTISQHGNAHQHFRVRIARSSSELMTWWQDDDTRCRLALPMLPATMSVALVGYRLSKLLAVESGAADDMVITSISDVKDIDGFGPATMIELATEEAA